MVVEYNAIIITEGSRLHSQSCTLCREARSHTRAFGDVAARTAPVRTGAPPQLGVQNVLPIQDLEGPLRPSLLSSLPHHISTSAEPTTAAVCGASK